jgi:N-acetylglucosamine-6-phosphate deacetylase
MLLEQGITTFVPTVQPCETAIAQLGGVLAENGLSSALPGMYVEGPFINANKKGGIIASLVKPPDAGFLQHLVHVSHRTIRVMTFAPELAGIEALSDIIAREHIVPCVGHSAATVEQAEQFRKKYYSQARVMEGLQSSPPAPIGLTHLFNAMSPISHKQSGLAMVPFLNSDWFAEINGDRVHLNQETLRLAYAGIARGRLVLISDAVITAGLEPRETATGGPTNQPSYFGKPVVSSSKGVRYRDSGVLIGSNQLLPQILRGFMEVTGATITDVFRFGALNPARLLGLDNQIGSIKQGKEGNVVVFDDGLHARIVITGSGVPTLRHR